MINFNYYSTFKIYLTKFINIDNYIPIIKYDNFYPEKIEINQVELLKNCIPSYKLNSKKFNSFEQFKILFGIFDITSIPPHINIDIYNLNFIKNIINKIKNLDTNLVKLVLPNIDFMEEIKIITGNNEVNLTVNSKNKDKKLNAKDLEIISNTPWFGNKNLAYNLANDVNSDLGLYDSYTKGPIFIYQIDLSNQILYGFKYNKHLDLDYNEKNHMNITTPGVAELNLFSNQQDSNVPLPITNFAIVDSVVDFKVTHNINYAYQKISQKNNLDILKEGIITDYIKLQNDMGVSNLNLFESDSDLLMKKYGKKIKDHFNRNNIYADVKRIIFELLVVIYLDRNILEFDLLMLDFGNNQHILILIPRENIKELSEDENIIYSNYLVDDEEELEYKLDSENINELNLEKIFNTVIDSEIKTYYFSYDLTFPEPKSLIVSNEELSDEFKEIYDDKFIKKIIEKWNTLSAEEKNIFYYQSGDLEMSQDIVDDMVSYLEDISNTEVFIPQEKVSSFQIVQMTIEVIKKEIDDILEINEYTIRTDDILFQSQFYICRDQLLSKYYLNIVKMNNGMVIPFLSWIEYTKLQYTALFPEERDWLSNSKNDNGGYDYEVIDDFEINENIPIVLCKGDVLDGKNKTLTIKDIDNWLGLIVIDTIGIDSNTDESLYPSIKNINIEITSNILSNCGILLTSIPSINQYISLLNSLLETEYKISYLLNILNGTPKVPITDEIRNSNLKSMYINIYNCNINFNNLNLGCGAICGSCCGFEGKATIIKCRAIGNSVLNNAGGICGNYAGDGGLCTIKNCSYKGDLSGSGSGGICGSYAGGFLNGGECNVNLCSFQGIINGLGAGGICGKKSGYLVDSKVYIYNSFCGKDDNECKINGVFSGGILGSNSAKNGYIEITNCRFSGEIGEKCGGIIGGNCCENGTINIDSCFSNSVIKDHGGGITGNFSPINGTLNILKCYCIGKVGIEAGGISGSNLTSNSGILNINYCYTLLESINKKGGGIVGSNACANTIIKCSYSVCSDFKENAGSIYGSNSTVSIKNVYSNLTSNGNGDHDLRLINLTFNDDNDDILEKINDTDTTNNYWRNAISSISYIDYNNLSDYESEIEVENYTTISWNNFQLFIAADGVEINGTISSIIEFLENLLGNGKYVVVRHKDFFEENTKLENIKDFDSNDNYFYLMKVNDMVLVESATLYKLILNNDNSTTIYKFKENFAKEPSYPLLISLLSPPWTEYQIYNDKPQIPDPEETEQILGNIGDLIGVDIEAGGISTNIIIIIIVIVLLVIIIKKLFNKYF